MDEKAFFTLEYNKIIAELSSYAASPMAKELAENLKPFTSVYDIEKAQDETTEAASMSLRKGNIPIRDFGDIRNEIKRADMGGALSALELLKISGFLGVCSAVKRYAKNENKSEEYKLLDELFSLITTLPLLEGEISKCILPEGEISDDASGELRGIRRQIRLANEKVRESLNSVIYSQTYKNMLQDPVITIRNNRYCVPVKIEYKNSFPGMVHDRSNTGSTLYIEPLSVVELNNKIKELEGKEKEEIERILFMLSAMVSEECHAIKNNLELMIRIDFIFAKAALSLKMRASRPLFNEKLYINIKKARHPLLDPKTVVPINIYLGDAFSTLLITGPNTGGKTVALKTLGLFSLMGQAGLHIPAFDNSSLAVFDNVFADIGDEQSIEQNLSTFSGHMKNVVRILGKVTDNSLVLFDELGAGTDPTEGAALAMSIINSLHERKIRTAVTTHYSELKAFAISTEGIENASLEFDVETLSPTYKLLIGIPGKSNAFAISKRLGLTDEIIDNAKEYISQENIRFEDIITDLEISRKQVAYEQERAMEYRKEAEKLKTEFESQKEKLEKQKEKIIEKAKEEARQIYKNAKEEADSIIKDITAKGKENASYGDLSASRQKINEKISEMSENALTKGRNLESPQNLEIGDKIFVVPFGQKGSLLTKPDLNGDVFVQASNMKMKVPLKDIMADKTKEPKKAKPKIESRAKADKSQYISAEIDLRGQLVDEALGNVDKYLDDAYLSGLKKVTIIHGKGTGALMNAIRAYLKTNPHVKFSRPGVFGEGEMGVTIVELM
ncbi:MAG: endonuclease MutS2 [Lachnospiraceae bacterium]|nr:endonuclease MutS2 [Lachnospiraceae bacterium]